MATPSASSFPCATPCLRTRVFCEYLSNRDVMSCAPLRFSWRPRLGRGAGEAGYPLTIHMMTPTHARTRALGTRRGGTSCPLGAVDQLETRHAYAYIRKSTRGALQWSRNADWQVRNAHWQTLQYPTLTKAMGRRHTARTRRCAAWAPTCPPRPSSHRFRCTGRRRTRCQAGAA